MERGINHLRKTVQFRIKIKESPCELMDLNLGMGNTMGKLAKVL